MKGVARQKEIKVGIYSFTPEQRTINGKIAHVEKTSEGKSKHAVSSGKKTHQDKDEDGKSVHAKETGRKLNSQVWESTEDGFVGNPGNVARHNKKNGWDPKAKVRRG